METTTDINEDLRTLAQDAENARLYGSPPDAIVLRAIELGMGTRAEIRRATGFDYATIEKCLERNSAALSSQMTGEIERFKLVGTEPKPLKPKPTPSPWRNPKSETTSNGHSTALTCVDCREPRSVGSAERCRPCYEANAKEKQVGYVEFDGEASPKSAKSSKFGISVNAEVRKIVEAMDVGWETDTPRLFAALLEAHPALKDHNDHAGLRTYISQGVSPLKGKLLKVVYKGRSGKPDILCRIAHPLSENGQDAVKIETKPRTEIAQPKPVEIVEPDKKQDIARPLPENPTSLRQPNQAMAQVQVMGGVKMHNEIEVRVSEMANWPAERISEFFDALSKVIEIPQRPAMPKTIKRAWSKEFENDNSEDGVTGLTMLYLVSMLHDGMEDHEKQAVWTLIQYLKRMSAALEAGGE